MSRSRRRRIAAMACGKCDGGFLINEQDRTWDVCDCAAGRELSEAIRKGEEDIAAGRLHKWSDIRREM